MRSIRLLARRAFAGYPARVRGRRWIWALAGGLVATFVVALLILPAIARSKAIAAARARGIELSVGRARIGFFRAELTDVRATLEGVRELTVTASTAGARIGLGGVRDLDLEGVVIELEGTPESIRSAVEGWRGRHPSSGGSGGGTARTITVRDVAARWRVLGIEPASARAKEVVVTPARVVVRGGDFTARLPFGEVRLAGVNSELARAEQKLGSVSADSLSIKLDAVSSAVAVPTVSFVADAPTTIEPEAKTDAWSVLARARARLEGALARFESGVELRVGEITVVTEKGTFGPWAARAVLGADAVAFELDPGEKAGRKPLVLRALVPRGRGKWTSELRVGPATLAELGVADGALGLADGATASIEARGAVELDPDEKTFAADGSITLKGAAIADARLADGTVQGIDVGLRGVLASKGDLRAWTLTGGAVELGKVRLELEGSYETVDLKDGKRGPRVFATWTVPVVPCGDALSSMPKGLLPKLDGMEMQGTFGARGRVGFDARLPDKTEVDLFLDQKCRVTKAPPALSVERFKEPFDLRVYDPKGSPRVAKFGPGTADWVALDNISPRVVDALMVCEDGAFYHHNGFSAAAIRNAIIANIKAGKFAVGASTITMQLAKNVFLDRHKQLSRKLQEAVLTAWLEQAMSKSELLELYLNVIEFGPNIYGIGPASWHWFGRPARDLDAVESIFLISILPSPVRRHALWDKGEASDGYMQYVHALLKEAHARGKLEDDEYQAALTRKLTFYKPGQPLPPPHGIQVVKGPIDKGGVDDPAFDPGGLSPPPD